MKIIALTGPKMVGKSTTAQAIIRASVVSTARISFADPLRDMLRALSIDSDRLIDQSLKEVEIEGLGRSPRYLLQTLGTEWGRKLVNENIWLWSMSNRIDELEKSGAEIVIIDDCRFDNEADWVKSREGFVVRLDRDGYEYGTDSHDSEKPLSFYDTIIDCSDADKAADEILNYIY